MSVEFMQKAFEISASDKRLTPADKLVLLRWAWKTRDAATPYEIKFRTVARELGLSRNGVRACVGRLVACGYLSPVSVQVVAGPAFQLGETGHTVTRQAARRAGHTVTRGGSHSDPQKGHTVTPFKKKEVKEGPAALNLDDLSKYALACLRSGQPVPIAGGRQVKPSDAAYGGLLDLLRRDRACGSA